MHRHLPVSDKQVRGTECLDDACTTTKSCKSCLYTDATAAAVAANVELGAHGSARLAPELVAQLPIYSFAAATHVCLMGGGG